MITALYRAASMLLLVLLTQAPALLAQNAAGPGATTESNSAAGQAQAHRRGPQRFMLTNSEGAVIQLWQPDLSILPLTAGHGGITLPRTGVDNYHALVVERDWGDLKEALIHYVYMRGKPSGHSTSELTKAEKTTFEVVPNPVPREHQHYRSDQHWNFLLRFNGAPATNIPVVLETSNGTRLNVVSDSKGEFSLHIPDDFSQLEAGGRDRRAAEFTVTAEITDGGISYQTQLSAEYQVNPSRWQSQELGVFITGIGLLAGGLLGRKAGGSS